MVRTSSLVSSLFLAAVLGGCCPPVATGAAPIAPMEPAPPPVVVAPPVEPVEPPLPPPPHRADLSTLPHPLPATVQVSPASTVESTEASNLTADGFAYATPVVKLSGGAIPGTIEISTGDELGWVPTTLAADLADVARLGHEKVAGVERPDGNWAAAYKLTDSCYIRSWSPNARLWCEAATPGKVGVACDQVQAVIDVCLTLEPAGTAVAPRLDTTTAFPNVKDAKALETVVAAGRAVAANDLAGFTALLAPGKIKIGRKKLDAKGLAAAVTKAGSLSRLLGTDCASAEPRSYTCRWNAEADGASGKLAVFSRDGYGVIPTIDLARQPDGAWRVAGFGSVDLGEP